MTPQQRHRESRSCDFAYSIARYVIVCIAILVCASSCGTRKYIHTETRESHAKDSVGINGLSLDNRTIEDIWRRFSDSCSIEVHIVRYDTTAPPDIERKAEEITIRKVDVSKADEVSRTIDSTSLSIDSISVSSNRDETQTETTYKETEVSAPFDLRYVALVLVLLIVLLIVIKIS